MNLLRRCPLKSLLESWNWGSCPRPRPFTSTISTIITWCPIKNFCICHCVGPRKSASNRAPNLLRPALPPWLKPLVTPLYIIRTVDRWKQNIQPPNKMISSNECLGWHWNCNVLYLYAPGLWSCNFSIYLHLQTGTTMKAGGGQMIKVLSRPTNKAEQLCGQKRNGGKCNREHFTKCWAGLPEIYGFHGFNISCFIISFNVIEFLTKH